MSVPRPGLTLKTTTAPRYQSVQDVGHATGDAREGHRSDRRQVHCGCSGNSLTDKAKPQQLASEMQALPLKNIENVSGGGGDEL